MLFTVITLLTALALASTAAAFAIFGIVALFGGLPVYAFIMGAVIELGKIVGVSWVYRNWEEPTKIKYFLLPLVVLAMLLTSAGIFSFLSKAHLDQTSSVSNNTSIIERIDQQIERESRAIQDAELVVQQLDETVATLIQFSRISGPDGARDVRASQQEERTSLRDIIDDSQSRIDELQDRRLDLNQELQAVQLEVGPVLYIASLLYDDGEDRLEDAVRWVIIAFIFVFDPMAILLLMAANYNLMKRSDAKVVEETQLIVEEPNTPTVSVPDKTSPTFKDAEITYDFRFDYNEPKTEPTYSEIIETDIPPPTQEPPPDTILTDVLEKLNEINNKKGLSDSQIDGIEKMVNDISKIEKTIENNKKKEELRKSILSDKT